jgi:cephalosporin-C deacetylase-like acetyl esterase
MIVAALLLFLPIIQETSPPAGSVLKEFYAYSHLTPSEEHETVIPGASTTTIKLEYPGSSGDTVHAIIVLPKAAGRAPCAILLHGLSGNKESMTQNLGPALLKLGIGYAAIDAPGHGERQVDSDKKTTQLLTTAFLTNKGDLLKAAISSDPSGAVEDFLGRSVSGGVMDERHLLDYLTSRKDIDYHHITVIGLSMGSIAGAILGGVDNRIKGMALLVGGDPGLPLIAQMRPEQRQKAFAGCCSLFAPLYTNRPLLMINGTHDTIMPRAATDRLYNAFPETEALKHISWYPSDHFLPSLATEEAVQWTAMQDGRPTVSR